MDDLEFIQRCVRKEKGAWDEFIDRYSRLIYRYICGTLKTQGLPVSQDVLNELFHDIFLALCKDNFKKLRSFKGKNGCTLASWLRQVSINFTIDHVRKNKDTISLDEENERGSSLKDIISGEGPSPSGRLLEQEYIRELAECIGNLSNEEKYFLQLHINKGLGLETVRSILNISRPAIDMRKSRIMDRLRKCFQAKGLLLD